MTKNVIETVMFKLIDGVSRSEFVAAANNMNVRVQARPGFVHRRLSCTEDGTWIGHIQRDNMNAAQAAAAEIGKAPGNATFLSAINGPRVQPTHSDLEVVIN